MVSRVRTNKKILPRDEHVSRGKNTFDSSTHKPYEYDLNWKSGTSRTKKEKILAVNRIDAFGQMIAHHAEEGKDFFVWNISRVLRYQAKARDY